MKIVKPIQTSDPDIVDKVMDWVKTSGLEHEFDVISHPVKDENGHYETTHTRVHPEYKRNTSKIASSKRLGFRTESEVQRAAQWIGNMFLMKYDERLEKSQTYTRMAYIKHCFDEDNNDIATLDMLDQLQARVERFEKAGEEWRAKQSVVNAKRGLESITPGPWKKSCLKRICEKYPQYVGPNCKTYPEQEYASLNPDNFADDDDYDDIA